MDALLQDLRYACRLFVRAPGFAAIAVLALALGIGANTAIFTVVNRALIERLPFGEPARLVVLWEETHQRPGRSNTVGPMNFLRWKERATSFERMTGLADTRANLTGLAEGSPEELTVQNVTDGFFDVVGVSPAIGRRFTAAESLDPDAAVIVLSDALWRRRFGADPAMVGRTVQLNGRPNTVIGVMPPDFRLLMRSNSLVGRPIDVWRPWVLPASARDARGRYMSVIARLKPGVSLTSAQSEMSAIASALTTELPTIDTGWTVRLLSIRDELAGDLRPALLLLAGAVAFVLLIACANVANLLLARGAARQREMAIRSALGAASGRVVRQLLTEAALLSVAGGALGLIVAGWSLRAMMAFSPVDLTLFGPVRLDYTVLAFTGAVSALTTMVCGLAPALEGGRVHVADLGEALGGAARQVGASLRHRSLREAFVVAQIALAVVLLAGAGLMLRSFAALQSVDPGMDTHNVLTARVALPPRAYDTPEKALTFFDRAVKKVAALPGVQSAGMISYLPFSSVGAATGFSIVGRPPQRPGQELVTDVSVCDNGYFQTLRLPLVSGRLFSEREARTKSNVVVINETLARRYFPGEDPIGQHLVIEMTDPNVPTEIIGVVGSSKFSSLEAETRAAVYWPHPQLPYTSMTLTLRVASEPASLAAAVERQIQSIDRDQPLSDVATVDQWVGKTLSRARFSSFLLMLFATLALILAALGIYGVMLYFVAQRTPEVGIRLALGAERRDIFGLILGNGARLAALGLAAGLALALALGRTIESLLFETTGADPVTLTAVVVALGAVALLACYVPARRAARIAPMEALRYQ